MAERKLTKILVKCEESPAILNRERKNCFIGGTSRAFRNPIDVKSTVA
jgi:hypothetical protein